jgi:S-(hydroxymethyl)glutathione dehydrogenase / alcohol dehydrogenase
MTESIEIRACVLRAPGAVATETVALDEPGRGQVRVRLAAAGVCHSDLHLADGMLGEGRWPAVLGHEGAGVVDAVGAGVADLAPGDHVVLAMVVPCGSCDACRRGNRTLCEPSGASALAGALADGSTRLTGSDGERLQHGFGVACFAEAAVVDARAAIPIPAELPLSQAALLGCGALTGYGAVDHAAQVGIGDRVCVIGCGGVGLQAIAAAKLAGAAQIIAVDLRADKLDHARRRGATDAVLSSGDDPAAEVRELSDGGVDAALEVVGAPATIRLAWDALRPGGTAVVVGLAPAGVDVPLPAIEFLSEKRIIGSYYGSADPALSLRRLVDLASAGRLALQDMVSHRIELDQVPEAFERLRRGEGDRSLIVIDPELAGEAAAELAGAAAAADHRTPDQVEERA